MEKVTEIKNSIPIIEDKIAFICKTYDVTSDELLLELIRFLDLIFHTNKNLSPSHIVDLVWHEFILFTRFYHHFCNKHYQRFIHHTPGGKEYPKVFKKTIHLYIKKYGRPHPKIWGDLATKEWKDINCGSCHN